MTSITQVWGLQPALDDKAEKSHAHRINQIAGLQELLDALIVVQDGQPSYINDITGLQDALDSKASSASISVLTAAIAGKAAAVHGHAIADITGLQDALDEAAQSGGGTIDSITGLTDALAAKAAAAHSHAIGNITGLQEALDAKANVGSGGTTTIAGVTGLTDALAGKALAENLSPILLTYTISQSSVYSGTTTATYANLTDGSFTTGAGTQSIAGANWIKATFSQPTRFNRLSFAAGSIPNFGSSQSYLNGCSIEISMDDTTWMRLFEGTLSEFSDAGGSLYYAFSPITALHVRVRKTGNSVGMTEFKIYG